MLPFPHPKLMRIPFATAPLALMLAITLGRATTLPAQVALRAAPSTRATSEVTLAYPEGQAPAGAKPMMIRLDYGQPHLRGRVLNTDSLVPYDKPWRAGANAATRLVTEVDLMVGGATLPKGTYVLFILPSRTGWTLLIQKNGAEPEASYDAKSEVARVELRVRTSTEPTESLSMTLIPVTGTNPAHGELRIAWGTVSLSTDWIVR